VEVQVARRARWRDPALSPATHEHGFRRLLLPVVEGAWRIGLRSLLLAGLLASSSGAKDAPAIAIVLFDAPGGAAYIQITSMTLNGKTDARVCDGVSKFDKGAYDLLPHIQLYGATSLERRADGVLTLTVNAKPVCVVPESVKFERNAQLTPAQAAEQAVLQGVPVSSSVNPADLPAFRPGVKVVFAAAPDAELADYLRAQRANSDKDWQAFLTRYPYSTRANEARNAMAEVHQQAAQVSFAEYQKLAAARKPDVALLRRASTEAQAANQAASGYRAAVALLEVISRELDALLEPDRAKLQAFHKALQDHTAGYSQLRAAKQHVELLWEVRTEYAPVLNLRGEIANEELKLETAVTGAESQKEARRYDDAFAALGPYAAFASEVPRIDAIVSAAYQYHFNQGRDLASQQNWEPATVEFRKAVAIRGGSQEAKTALSNAVAQLTLLRNQQEADRAIRQSNEYAGKSQFIEAYDTLADLPDAQRALVKPQLSALTRDYATAAARRAQRLQEIHIPVRGRADEDGVREAYDLLDRASSLSGDPAMTLKRDFLASKISAYYLEQAKRYLDRPLGSGAGMGWIYLEQAQRYGSNFSTVKDQMARYAPLYQRRARLSIGIVLRDQTSRRNSVGFADQLTDAIAAGLETSGVSVDLVRKPPEAPDMLQPNFLLVGEILEHRVVKNSSLESLSSKYRTGSREVPNPAWPQVNNDYQAAQQKLATAQQVLAYAQAHYKKQEVIAAANDGAQQAQQRVDELRHKLETTSQTKVEAILEPYHYTKKTVDLTATIDLALRMNDQAGNPVEQAVKLHKDNHKSAVVLDNVKPEDSEGITNKSVEPDEVQFLTDLEIEARDALVKAVREKVSGLPVKILQEARKRAQRGDIDGSAEEYVLYLNATPVAASAEREEASKFLRDRFNVRVAAAGKL